MAKTRKPLKCDNGHETLERTGEIRTETVTTGVWGGPADSVDTTWRSAMFRCTTEGCDWTGERILPS